jgi:hypothetical protein
VKLIRRLGTVDGAMLGKVETSLKQWLGIGIAAD